ncbi:transcriptional regulator [Flavobacteriaceae bacterium]|jgi:DNA-binding MarR family transcriptional regulator|nr:transcriptional regulator [Flavobacteriaceae bacterium]MDC3218317.1 transcriptional regulator [Flavobacteriaceae bacterium]
MYKNLDPILHAPLRLAIVSYLMAHSKGSFKELKENTKATSGNISVQLKKLEEAGYLRIEKSFLDNYPLTQVALTKKGIKAFENYVEALKKYIF